MADGRYVEGGAALFGLGGAAVGVCEDVDSDVVLSVEELCAPGVPGELLEDDASVVAQVSLRVVFAPGSGGVAAARVLLERVGWALARLSARACDSCGGALAASAEECVVCECLRSERMREASA